MDILCFILVVWFALRLGPYFEGVSQRRATRNNSRFEAHWRRQSQRWSEYLAYMRRDQ